MKCCKSGLLFLLMSLVIFACGTPIEEIAIDQQQDLENCGNNQHYDVDLRCICNKGFYYEVEQDACLENECDPICGSNQICENSACICKDHYINIGVPGTLTCVLEAADAMEIRTVDVSITPNATTTQDTTQETTTKPAPTTTTTTLAPTTTSSTTTTTTAAPTTPNTTTTEPQPTHKPTTTTLAPTTTKKPKRKHKMSAWTITGIIILVACLCGLLGYIVYRKRQQGSLRIPTSPAR